MPILRDVASDQQNHGLQARLVIDRDTASRLGITPQMIDDTLYDAFGQRQVSTMFTQLNQYHVVLETTPEFGRTPEQLGDYYYVHTPQGTVPLERRDAPREPQAPLAINHQGQFPVVTLSFNLAPGASLGEAVEAIDKAKAEARTARQHSGSFQGTAQAFQASLTNEPLLILAALVTVYIVLGVLYESYIHPITILSTLPSAGVGALLALLICQHRLERDRADRHHPADRHREEERDHDDRLRARGRAQGSTSRRDEAIYQACLLRFRPIMMTTMAALLGGVPLALGIGHGRGTAPSAGHHDRRRPDLQPVLTLYTTPVIYLAFDRLATRFARDAWTRTCS